jgi:hypothetical protein
MFLVLAIVLGSLWAGGLAVSEVGDPANRFAAASSLPSLEPAALRDRASVLGAPAERSGRSGRPAPVLLGLLAATLAFASRVWAGRPGPGVARARALIGRTQLEARAPPALQPA